MNDICGCESIHPFVYSQSFARKILPVHEIFEDTKIWVDGCVNRWNRWIAIIS